MAGIVPAAACRRQRSPSAWRRRRCGWRMRGKAGSPPRRGDTEFGKGGARKKQGGARRRPETSREEGMLEGLQMNLPLAVSCLIDHAAAYHADTEIVARTIEGDVHRTTYGAVGSRTKRLARALLRLGVAAGDRIGSLAWNTHRHFEMFYGVSGTGAVLHTINPRLFAEQLVYIINHAEDRILFIDAATLPVFEQIAARLTTVERCVMMAQRERMPAKSAASYLLCYEELLAAES